MLLLPSGIGRIWAPCRLLRACSALTSEKRTWHAPIRSAMSLAKVDGAAYGGQLSAKADRLRSKFADFSLPELEIFASQTEHYRMRSGQLIYHPSSSHLPSSQRCCIGLVCCLNPAIPCCRTEFRVWHEGPEVYYIMFEKVNLQYLIQFLFSSSDVHNIQPYTRS